MAPIAPPFLQSNLLYGSMVGPAKNLTNKWIEPLSDNDLLMEHYKMGPAKSWNPDWTIIWWSIKRMGLYMPDNGRQS